MNTTISYNPGRAVAILSELAMLAHKTDRGCSAETRAIVDRDPEDVQHQVDLLQAMLCRLGWLADQAAMELGAEPYRGDAAEWMLPSLPAGVDLTRGG